MDNLDKVNLYPAIYPSRLLTDVDSSKNTNFIPTNDHPYEIPGMNNHPTFESKRFPGYVMGLNGKELGSHLEDVCGCGDFLKGANVCDACGHVDPFVKSCNNFRCPVCYSKAGKKAGNRVQDRFNDINESLSRKVFTHGVGVNSVSYMGLGYRMKRQGSVRHVIMTMPKDTKYIEDFDVVYGARANEYAKRIGMSGFVRIFHPYRIKHDINVALHLATVSVYNKDTKLNDSVSAIEFYKGVWGCVHADILNLGDKLAYCEWGPHYHLIGYFPRIDMKSDKFQKITGWVYKNKGGRDSISGTVAYLLSHHAIINSKNGNTKPGYVYCGFIAYNKLKFFTDIVFEDIACDICGSSMTKYAWVDRVLLPSGSYHYDFNSAESLGAAFHQRKKRFFNLGVLVGGFLPSV